MESIAVSTLSGLALAAALHGGILALTLRFFRSNWGCWYPAVLITLASILSLHAFYDFRTILPWITVAICLCNVLIPSGYLKKIAGLRQSRAVLVAGTLGAFFIAYAAYPVFRSDQWTYHLIIPKMLDATGTLTPPIFNDHIYFTGVYEYLGSLARSVGLKDTAMQSFADSFTALSFLTGITGVIHFRMETQKKVLPANTTPAGRAGIAIIFATFCLYAMPTPDMIYNFKPDGLVAVFAALVFVLFCQAVETGERRPALLAGFYMTAALGLKFTWVHFALPAAAVLLFITFYKRLPRLVALSALGGIIGFLIILPVLAKNQYFFGNPLHPVQVWIFKSSRFNDVMASYWQNNSNAIQHGHQYIGALAATFYNWFSTMLFFFTLPLLLLFDKNPRLNNSGIKWRENAALAILAGYFALWPLLFGSDIFPRFFYASCGLFIVMLWEHFSKGLNLRLLVAGLVAAVALNGSLEVKIFQIAKGIRLNAYEFYAAFPSPMDERNDYESINLHRKKFLDDSRQLSANVLSDNNSAYFFDGRLAYLDGYDFDFYKRRFSFNPETSAAGSGLCPGSLLKFLDIRYLYAWRLPFGKWPAWLQPALLLAEYLPESSNAMFLSNSALAHLLEQEPAICAELLKNSDASH